MLDQRQLVLLAAPVRDQPLGQLAAYLAAVQRGRLTYGADEVGATHPREQVLGLVNRLGETWKAGTVAEELRAHGEDGIEPVRWAPGQAKQDVGEECRLLPVGPCEPEQLLELVEEQAEMVAGPVAEHLGQSRCRVTAPVEDAENGEDRLRIGGHAAQGGQRLGEVPERSVARHHGARSPRQARAGVILLQPRQHPGADE